MQSIYDTGANEEGSHYAAYTTVDLDPLYALGSDPAYHPKPTRPRSDDDTALYQLGSDEPEPMYAVGAAAEPTYAVGAALEPLPTRTAADPEVLYALGLELYDNMADQQQLHTIAEPYLTILP